MHTNTFIGILYYRIYDFVTSRWMFDYFRSQCFTRDWGGALVSNYIMIVIQELLWRPFYAYGYGLFSTLPYHFLHIFFASESQMIRAPMIIPQPYRWGYSCAILVWTKIIWFPWVPVFPGCVIVVDPGKHPLFLSIRITNPTPTCPATWFCENKESPIIIREIVTQNSNRKTWLPVHSNSGSLFVLTVTISKINYTIREFSRSDSYSFHVYMSILVNCASPYIS